MNILVINPNTSEFVTDRAVEAARSVAHSDTVIKGVTGRFGPAIINSESDMVVGAHSAVDLAAAYAGDFDAVALAVSFDTGLAALREILPLPVAGMAESSIQKAMEISQSIVLLSFAMRTQPLYEKLALSYMPREYLSGVHCMDALSAEQLQCPDIVKQRLEEEIDVAVHKYECDTVVLLATAFAGLAEQITPQIRVIDAVKTMIEQLERSQSDADAAEKLISQRWPQRKSVQGLSAHLTKLYQQFPEF